MKVIILCGGKGVRAFPFTKYMPKPMLPLGGSPIIMQVIKNFIQQGFTEFILAAGYRKSILCDYFDGKNIGADITILDTGEDSDTGERIHACRHLVGDTFIATYADGLCNVSIRRLIEFHQSHEGISTITSVPMLSQYGVLDIEKEGKVSQLREKPLIHEHWINAGYIVFDKKVFEHWQGGNLEQEVLPYLVSQGLVFSYRHNGFFKSMDSYKDLIDFENLLDNGEIPWLAKETN